MMDANEILKADMLDLIFDGRNKQYGAYELRKNYSRRLARAIVIAIALALIIFFAALMADLLFQNTLTELTVLDAQMAEIKKNDPAIPKPPPVTPKAPPPQINQVKFTPPTIVKDEAVKEDEKIEDIKEDQAISTKTVTTENTNQIVAAPIEEKGTQVVEAPKGNDEDKVFQKVEIEAEFPDGQDGWVRYLKKHLNPNVPIEHGAPPAQYRVMVRFIVNKNGQISEVQAETGFGYGMEAEAVKVIKNGPAWIPGIQNGRPVSSYKRQPITFVVEDQ